VEVYSSNDFESKEVWRRKVEERFNTLESTGREVLSVQYATCQLRAGILVHSILIRHRGEIRTETFPVE